jgi:hypothetical protein
MEEEAVPANAVRGVGVEWVEKRISETVFFNGMMSIPYFYH